MNLRLPRYIKGTPVIVDGKIDDIWSIAEEMPVEKILRRQGRRNRYR